MNRKDFLNKIWISGVCACSGSILLSQDINSSEENKKTQKEDWRINFSKTRYAKLMKILQTKLTKDEFAVIKQHTYFTYSVIKGG